MPLLQLHLVECQEWIQRQGVSYYEEYNSFLHINQKYPGNQSKSWKTPEHIGGLLCFWECVFFLLPEWDSIMLSSRDGNWKLPFSDHDDPKRFMYGGFFELLGIDLQKDSGIHVLEGDANLAAWLMYVRMACAMSFDDDTQAFSDRGKFFLNISHHDFVNVNFQDAADRDRFDAAMKANEYDYVRWTKSETP